MIGFFDTNNPSARDFQITRADLSPSRDPRLVINMLDHIGDLTIYEHLDKPYLTGQLIVIDGANIRSNIRPRGIDRITFEIGLPENEASVRTITFYIEEITAASNATDGEGVFVAHMIDELGFVNKHSLVNNVIQTQQTTTDGTGKTAITQLYKNFFGREIVVDTEDFETTPPFTFAPSGEQSPLDVAEAIRARMHNNSHSPYYLFHNFSSEKTYLRSLEKILDTPSKVKKPLTFSQVSTKESVLSANKEMYTIYSFSDKDMFNINKIHKEGFVNTMFWFYDITTSQVRNPHMNGTTRSNGPNTSIGEGLHWTAYDMFEKAPNGWAKSILGHLYPEKGLIPWRSPTQGAEPQYSAESILAATSTGPGGNSDIESVHFRPESTVSINLTSREVYEPQFVSYLDGDTLPMINAHAIWHWTTTDLTTIEIPGRLFLLSDPNVTAPNNHTGVGSVVELSFYGMEGGKPTADTEKSGNHMIYAMRHNFTPADGYTVNAAVVKVGEHDQVAIEVP